MAGKAMGERITIRVTPEMKEALELLYASGNLPGRTRQEVFRLIIEDWLTVHGYLVRSRENQSRASVGRDKEVGSVPPSPEERSGP